MPNYDQPDQNRATFRAKRMPLPDDLWPGHVSLVTYVRETRVRVNSAGAVMQDADNELVQGTSKLKDFELCEPRLKEIYGEWVFGIVKGDAGSSEDMVLTWNPPVASEDEGTAVKDEWQTEEKWWHPVVTDANLVLQYRVVGSGASEFFPVVRKYHHSGRNLHTKIRRRVYVRNTPWPKSKLDANEPLPTPISIDAYGIQVDLGECLHPQIDITGQDRADVVVLDLVPSRTDEKIVADRSLAATNHTGWQAHIYRVETREVDGLYFRITYEAHPPPEPPLSVQ